MKNDLDTTESSQVARDILAYMHANPDTQGTLEGIIEWWLLEQKIERSAVMVKEALNELVNRGLIVEQKSMDERVRYRINQSRIEDIAAILGQEDEEEQP